MNLGQLVKVGATALMLSPLAQAQENQPLIQAHLGWNGVEAAAGVIADETALRARAYTGAGIDINAAEDATINVDYAGFHEANFTEKIPKDILSRNAGYIGVNESPIRAAIINDHFGTDGFSSNEWSFGAGIKDFGPLSDLGVYGFIDQAFTTELDPKTTIFLGYQTSQKTSAWLFASGAINKPLDAYRELQINYQLNENAFVFGRAEQLGDETFTGLAGVGYTF